MSRVLANLEREFCPVPAYGPKVQTKRIVSVSDLGCSSHKCAWVVDGDSSPAHPT